MEMLTCSTCGGLTLRLYVDRCKACVIERLLTIPKDDVVTDMVERMTARG